jgi:hypothetical protein
MRSPRLLPRVFSYYQLELPFDSHRTQALTHLLSSTLAILQQHVFAFRPFSTYFSTYFPND